MAFAGSTAQTRPLIGVTPRWFAPHDFFCAGESIGDIFMNALLDVGAMPIMLPITSDEDLIAHYVDLCDGFALPGGHNVDARRWGEEPIALDQLSPERDGLEFPLVRMVLEANKPLLAICRGAQVLNVALGGTLIQDLTTIPPLGRDTLWAHAMVLDHAAHPVRIEEDSLLCRCFGGRTTVEVNSSHGQCVGALGKGVRIVGRATDGIVEAIEVPSQRFCVGVQWHPEYTWHIFDHDRRLFAGLVEAARS